MIKKIKEKASNFFDKHGLKSMTIGLHALYGLLTFSYIGPQLFNLFTGNEVDWARAITSIWVVQVWFYMATNMTLRETLYKQKRLLDEAGGAVSSLNAVNSALVDRMSKLPPQILHDIGVRIKKNKK